MPIAESWLGIKSRLRSYKVKKVIKNQSDIALEFSIEIRSNFDHLAE